MNSRICSVHATHCSHKICSGVSGMLQDMIDCDCAVSQNNQVLVGLDRVEFNPNIDSR